VLLLVGFPIALILAWAYDVTPQGIRATPTPSTPGSHRRRNLILKFAGDTVLADTEKICAVLRQRAADRSS